LTPYLLHEAAEDKGVCPDFLLEAVSRFGEDDTVKGMLTKAVAGLSFQLSTMTMNDNYKPYVTVGDGFLSVWFILIPLSGTQTYLSVSGFSYCYCRRPSISDGDISAGY
jgi:hypothetical protein